MHNCDLAESEYFMPFRPITILLDQDQPEDERRKVARTRVTKTLYDIACTFQCRDHMGNLDSVLHIGQH